MRTEQKELTRNWRDGRIQADVINCAPEEQIGLEGVVQQNQAGTGLRPWVSTITRRVG